MKKSITIIIGVIVVVLVILGAAGVFGDKTTDQPTTIKLGAAFALSGDAAEWGEMSLFGVQMAVAEINQSGGIDGKEIELIVEDTASESRHAISAVSKLAHIDKVAAIVGPSWLDVYHGPGEVAASADIVMITPDSGTEALNDGKKLTNVYSTWYRVAPKAELLAQTAASEGIDKLFLLVPNDSYYIHFADTLARFAKEQGIEVVGKEVFNDDSDLRTELLAVAEKDSNGVFFVSYSEKHFAEYARSIKNIAPGIALYGDEVTKDFIDQGKYIDELDGITYFHASQPASTFVEDFTQAHGVAPAFGAAPAYDSTFILAESIAKKKESESIADYIDNHSFQTVSFGKMSFDEIGGVVTPGQQYDLFRLTGGEVETIN